MYDNDNGFGKLLGVLFFAGTYIAGVYAGKKKMENQIEQQNQLDLQEAHLNEINRLRKENEELKRKVPKIVPSENDHHFPLRF